MKQHLIFVKVNSANNLEAPQPPVTTVVTRGGDGQKVRFTSNRKTVIKLKDESPFKGLRPNTNLSIRPGKILEVKPGLGRSKKYKVLCGRLEGRVFVPWGGGGLDTPPIP